MTRNATNSTVSGCTVHEDPLPAGALTTTGSPSVSSSANQTGTISNIPLAVGQNSNHKSSLSRGAAAGVGVAVTILVLALIFAALCFLRRRSRRAYLLEENRVIGNSQEGTKDEGTAPSHSIEPTDPRPETLWTRQLSEQPLRTAHEYTGFLSNFTQEHLRRFYEPNDETIQNVAMQAARDVARKINVPQNLMPGLAKLALYDFIILCGTYNVLASLEKYGHFKQVDLIEKSR
jgi:hypothetical protein